MKNKIILNRRRTDHILLYHNHKAKVKMKMVVPNRRVDKDDLKRFLDDIVFISKTRDEQCRQAEIVSALHRQNNSDYLTKVGQQLNRKTKYRANERQLSLYNKGVEHLRKRYSSAREQTKVDKKVKKPVVKGPTKRQVDQYEKYVNKQKVKRIHSKSDNQAKNTVSKQIKKNPRSSLSKLHRGLPELYENLRAEVESLSIPDSLKEEEKIFKKDPQLSLEPDVTFISISNSNICVSSSNETSKSKMHQIEVDPESFSKISSHYKSRKEREVEVLDTRINGSILQERGDPCANSDKTKDFQGRTVKTTASEIVHLPVFQVRRDSSENLFDKELLTALKQTIDVFALNNESDKNCSMVQDAMGGIPHQSDVGPPQQIDDSMKMFNISFEHKSDDIEVVLCQGTSY